MSEKTATVAIAKTAAEIITEKLADFHDRMPPMLVKELRQGMRAKAFLGVFLTLQAFLGLVMLMGISTGGSSNAGEVISKIIFFFFTTAVLCIQPLRAINSLHGEIKSGAIDLMVLTRLSARRIALGKWAAIMAQSLLIFVSIVPYLILRYFFGGMDLFAELLTMVTILIASGCMTAINVGVSANGAILLRSLLPLIAGAFLFFGTCGICFGGELDDLLRSMSMEDSDSWAVYSSLVLGVVYYSWMLFSMAAASIAPMAENHSTLNRLLGLVVMSVVASIMYLADAPAEAFPAAMGLLAIPIVQFALCEPAYLLPIVTKPFIKRGLLGRISGWGLYPAYTSGVFFALAMIAFLVLLGYQLFDTLYGNEAIVVLNLCCASMLFSAVLLRLFRQKINNLHGAYIGFTAAGFIIFGVVAAVCESMDNKDATFLFCWIPQVSFFLLDEKKEAAEVISYLLLVLYSGFLFLAAWKDRCWIQKAVKEQQDTKL
jgi:hypothetical protein